MSNWRNKLSNLAGSAEAAFDQLKAQTVRRLGLQDPLIIQPYLGYGTRHSVWLPGRVLENEGIKKTTDRDSIWDNMLNVYRQLESDEIAGAVVEGRLQGVTTTAVTDEEGDFVLEFELDTPLPAEPLWHEIELTLTAAPNLPPEGVTARGRALVPPETAVFGIISDIDDTIMVSNATNYLKAAQLLFLGNARTRLPFKGVSAFYDALQHGPGDTAAHNPLFYVSSSPRNIFLLLNEFLNHHKIPTGPLFLRDYGFDLSELAGGGHHGYKIGQVDRILTTYPDLPFILIGDSGQEDPEIYAAVVARYPEQIRAIYIRDVTLDVRATAVDAIAEKIVAGGVPMMRVADSLAAAKHAVEVGFIRPAALNLIATAVQTDSQ